MGGGIPESEYPGSKNRVGAIYALTKTKCGSYNVSITEKGGGPEK
jgi:hypothetical protein